AATTESRLLIRGNLEDEFASFRDLSPRMLAISKPIASGKSTLAQGLGNCSRTTSCGRRNLGRHRRPSRTAPRCHVDGADLRRPHATRRTSIDQANVPIIRTVPRHRPLIDFSSSASLALLLGNLLGGFVNLAAGV